MRPKGLHGSKKVQDIFVDRKIAVTDKAGWPILVDSSDRILAVVGLADSEWESLGELVWRISYDPCRANNPPKLPTEDG